MKYLSENFDPDANLVGVPTKQPPNKKSHSVRESTSYAYGLLMTGDSNDRARAQEIIKKVIASQDTRPDAPTCGVYLWYAEDNWETVKNPDLNAAAFNGLVLALIADLDRQKPCLDPDVRDAVEKSCQLALAEVLRRNVDPDYTNIAILSSAFAASCEKLWKVPGAGEFADAKLDAILSLTGDGGFYEYLSPTYYAVDLLGASMAHKFSFSDAFSAKVDNLTNHLWKEIAASYHAPTYQLAGPFGRSYGNNMLQYCSALKYWLYLGLDGAYPIPDSETDHAWDQGGLTVLANIPVSLRPEFKEPTEPLRDIAIKGPYPRTLTQYRDGNFILGTVAVQDEWKQKRNLVAYWRNDGPPPDGLKVGFCLDESNETLPGGFPFGELHFYGHQVNGAALVALAGAKTIPNSGGCELVFDSGATSTDGKDPGSLKVQDGTMTAYIYPVSPSSATFTTKVDANTLRVSRPWTSADVVGPMHVISYLVVFRSSDKPAPEVSDIVLKADGTGASAKVDSDNISLTF